MNVPSHIFKSYDIRAIYPTEINEDNLPVVITAIYTFFTQKLNKEHIQVAIGRDMRLSAPSLYPILTETLVNLGAEVIDLGLVSTPTFYFAVSHYKYDTGIQLTASHNPKEYNGLKFVINSDHGLIKIGKPTGMEDIKQMVLDGIDMTPREGGSLNKKEGVLEDEVTNALNILNNPKIIEYKIVADPANAMGGTYINALFEKIPGNLVRMNFELDGSFPVHQPDPLQPENLVDLQKKVVEEQADVGLAPDGDGDRMFFVDEKGNVVPPTIITALVAREMLKEHPGSTILFDIRYILTPQKIVEELGGKSEITRVGHAFITEQLGKTGGIFAGESSGHYYFQATGNAESQVAIVLCVLKVMSEENKSLSQIVEELRRSFESGEINFEVTNAQEIIESIKSKYSDGELNTLDGLAISYPEWRFSVRTSNTEPLLRLNVEGYDRDTVEQKKNELVNLIKSTAKHE